MYKYKYVPVNLEGGFSEADHKEIIDKHVKEGWKVIQALPMHYDSYGQPTEYEIIFQKKIEE
ncbi:DUF4177 domain-containing protein [Clostridium aestuarii]|uniref:DUF4177 domain-containing protein n=1 Tax=Clostridium aestuarii TaxID=338193 RepID=A0ABT4CWR6_9CLOT|nr:DUF4177 domain-containing protein [Clostridium aestuarii]MCY6483414.1 DUF4177 domain-containing protein [Clostridium aestuarii]